MVQDVRSSASDGDFDLLTPDSVMRALAVVRGSALAPEAKRELRDLIFAYTSSGGDPALRTLIQSELQTLAVPSTSAAPTLELTAEPISVVAEESVAAIEAAPIESMPVAELVPENPPLTDASPARVVAAGFRTGRPTPQFRQVAPTAAVTAPAAIEQTVVPETPVEVAPVITTPVPQPLPTPDPTPVPMVPKAIVDEKLAEVTPPSEPSVEYKAPYREDSSADAARDRINAIKQMVNTKVGNPVNLVDMDNNIGRAYMTSLLEAMKAVSGGGGDVGAAMTRLEEVVVEVEKLFSTHPVPEKKAETETAATPPVAATSVAPIPAPVEVATPRIEATIPHKVEMSEATMLGVIESDTTSRNQVPVTSADTTVISPMAIASSRFKNVLPVTDQAPLKTPADLPTAAEMKARSGITDPLQDPDVDLGLEQLLGEWSLFKKSGVFGTGPKGRQHPLFLKLATIPMPLILSGRFEGSTNEIRQSITDYMNGWRYEQGIIYEQDETFEHYLRRVIRHIIDSQTRRRGA